MEGVGPTAPDGTPDGAAGGGPIQVVATFSILGDFVANVGGDRIQLTTLVGPGADAHTFEPSPADSVALADAALVFENGHGFEPWLEDLVSAAGARGRLVAVAEVIPPLQLAEEDHGDVADGEGEDGEGAAGAAAGEHTGEHTGGGVSTTPPSEASGEAQVHEHTAGGGAEAGGGTEAGAAPHDEHAEHDPHVWHDVLNAMQMVEAIRDALVEADPAGAAAYQANAAAYLAELRELDTWVTRQVATLPPERRKLVTAHDTFGYFARRYGFEVVGTALGAATTEAGDPAAADIAALVEGIRAGGVPAIFAENVQQPKLMAQIAREAGVRLGPPLYTDALGPPGGAGDTYVKMIRANVTALVGALGS